MRSEECGSPDLTYQRDALLVAISIRVEGEVLVLDSPKTEPLDGARILCGGCGRPQRGVRWKDWRLDQLPAGESKTADGTAMDAIADYINQPGETQGADFLQFVERLLPRTGRELIDFDV